MKWGVALNVKERISETVRKAKIADIGGIDQVWITDFPVVKYAPAVAAAVAEQTTACRIGVGLVSPLLYSITQISQFISTLSDSYGERFDLLLGPGDRQALANIGISYSAKDTVNKTTRALEEIKQSLSEAGHNCNVLLGAQGPVMIKASLKADGVLLNFSDIEMINWALSQIIDTIPDDFQLGVFPPTYVGNCHDFMTNQSISHSAAMVALGLGKTVSDIFGIRGQLQAARDLMKEQDQINKEIMNLLGTDLLRRFAFCGETDHLQNFVKDLETLGLTSIVFGPPQGIRKQGVEILVNVKNSM